MNRSQGILCHAPYLALAFVTVILLQTSHALATGCPEGSQPLSATTYWEAGGVLRVWVFSPVAATVNLYWEPGDIDAGDGTIIRLAANSTVGLTGTPPGGAIAYKVQLSDASTGAVLYCLHAPIPPASVTADALRRGALRGKGKFIDFEAEWRLTSRSAIAGVKGAGRLGSRSATHTLSGTTLNQGAATTTWLLYPDACTDLLNGTYNPRTTPIADSLDGYGLGGPGPYQRMDLSLNEPLWHVADAAEPPAQRPEILQGSRSIWCGKFDPSWTVPVGYPNSLAGYQILYVDTGSHASDYTLSFLYNFSSELGYDHVYLVGGGGGEVDPIGNSRAILDAVISTGSAGSSDLLVSWTGSIRNTTPNATSIYTVGGPVEISGAGASPPDAAVATSVQVAADHRALYFVFQSDADGSSEDGVWPQGHGQVLDLLSTTDNGLIYGDQTAAGGVDLFGGSVLVGTPSAPIVSARVTPGSGELWQIVDGGTAPSEDQCAIQKGWTSDRFFFGADPATRKTIPGQANALATCPIPVPAGTASLTAIWDQYGNLPQGSGFVQSVQYSYFKDGDWSDWINAFEEGGVGVGASRRWSTVGTDLTEATQADLVQLRFLLTCVPTLAADGVNCGWVDYGILYDNLCLEAVTGVPAPAIDVFPGSLPQTTFVDGTMTGLNCTFPPCWPGVRGSDIAPTTEEPARGIHDNFNSPLGDSIVVVIASPLRRNGMGVNWRHGFDKSVDGGLTITHINANFNASFDTPRMIYRLFDPATRTWSPLDSTELDADAVAAAGGDTIVVGSAFRVDWPPRDKAGLNLPGGFTINGHAAYNDLAFLPRGCQMQYTFKAVDINGSVAYLPLELEVEEFEPIIPGYPALPFRFAVLPGLYPPGSGGSLLAGRADTPILNLDGAYGAWSYGFDPVAQALRGLGVRADRYRLLQGMMTGANIGGHELNYPPDNQRARIQSNYFPNVNEYAIRDSLAKWYRIIIQSSHGRTFMLEDEADARLLQEWSMTETGANGGDRCIFVSGDDYFNSLLRAPEAEPRARRFAYAQSILGVTSVQDAWVGTNSNAYPTIEDGFANPASGPGLVAGYTYPVDGGCPRANRFDGLTDTGSSDSRAVAYYPMSGGITDVASVANSSEFDAVADNDRSKALGYGFSIQYVRKAGIPTRALNYTMSGVEERLKVLYKFLTSCRGSRSGAPSDTGKCWPCPTDGNMMGNWQSLSGFQTGSYGPLYPIQDPATATGVEEAATVDRVPYVNMLSQNRPNPFNPRTVIGYSLASEGRVQVRIFDIGGRLVRTLVDGSQTAGWHDVPWNGRTDTGGSSASGMYFYRITFPNGENSAKKMVILR